MALFYLIVPLSHESVTVSRQGQYQERETELAKWSSAIIHFVIYTCAFPTSMKTAHGIYMTLILCVDVTGFISYLIYWYFQNTHSHLITFIYTK